MKWLCRFIGHGCCAVQSDEIASWVSPNHWCWPGVITYCPRCGMVYRNAYTGKRTPPFADQVVNTKQEA